MAGNNVRIRASVDDKASGPVDNIRDKFEKLRSQGAKGLAIGAGAAITAKGIDLVGTAIAGVGNAISGAIDDASNLQQATGAVESVLGSASSKVQAFGKTAAEAYGLSAEQVQRLGAITGAQLQGMGFSADQAADHTIELQKRAADMAATFGGSVEDALTAISALMRGERDPIEKYGVAIKAVDVNARIAAMGLDTSTAAAEKQATATATLALLMEQTAKTQGQFGRESDTLAGVQARLSAKMENASAAIGSKLMPIWADLLTLFSDVGVPVISLLADVIGLLVKPIELVVNAVGVLKDAAGTAFDDMALNFGDMGDRVHQIADDTGTDFQTVKDRIKEAMEESGLSFEDAAKVAEREFAKIPKTAKASALTMTTELHNQLMAAKGVVQTDAEEISNVIPNAIKDKWDDVRAAAYQTMVEQAKGLLDAQNEPKVAMDALLQVQEDALTRGAEIARLKGQLTSTELSEGLKDERPAVRAQAQAVRAAIMSRLAELDVDARGWGTSIGSELASGLGSQYTTVYRSASAIAEAVNRNLAIHSEPKDGPMRGITKWGGNIVETIAGDMLAKLDRASSASSRVAAALGSALTPSVGTPAMAAVGGGSRVQNFYITFEGNPPTDTPEELHDTVSRLARLGNGTPG